jgi:hypothetical protein
MAAKIRKVSTLSRQQQELLKATHRLAGLGRVPGAFGAMPAARGDGREPAGPERPPRDEKGHGRGREPEYKPQLLCRTFSGDIGGRPITDPNFVFWESPDIWIEGPSGDPDQAVAGQPNTVKVHVWNNGLADAWAATVELFWCDPSVGVNMASAHPIGSTTVPVYAGQDAVVAFPWTPSLVNGGHECLVAQVYEFLTDNLEFPFQPKLDRRVGQRNVSVLQAAPGQLISLPFVIPNYSFMQARSTLHVEQLEGPALASLTSALGMQGAVAARGGGAMAGLVEVSRERLPAGLGAMARPMRFRPSGHAGSSRPSDMRATMALGALAVEEAARVRKEAGVLGKGRRGPLAPPAAASVDRPPASLARFSLQAALPSSARRGNVRAIRVVERVDGVVTGGVTLVLKAR